MINPLDKALVDSIIGDIRTMPDFDEIIDDVANMTEQEWTELEAEFDALPDIELTPEQEAWCKEQARETSAYAAYCYGMSAIGLNPIDPWEWSNMTIKPTIPNGDEEQP